LTAFALAQILALFCRRPGTSALGDFSQEAF